MDGCMTTFSMLSAIASEPTTLVRGGRVLQTVLLTPLITTTVEISRPTQGSTCFDFQMVAQPSALVHKLLATTAIAIVIAAKERT